MFDFADFCCIALSGYKKVIKPEGDMETVKLGADSIKRLGEGNYRDEAVKS
jgi:hypothetical protein